MDQPALESIKEFLQQAEVQKRIYRRMLHMREQISVPIGGAVSLLDFSENQLRKWEGKGLLNPLREGKHRHYSLSDLDKLAIIRELIDANFQPGNIPSDIDHIWAAIAPLDKQSGLQEQSRIVSSQRSEVEYRHINQRIERARQDLFWRYYASRALRLSLHLIRESIPSTERSILGLVLPLRTNTLIFNTVTRTDQLPILKESLVGWLGASGSSHTLLTPNPSFEHPAQYRLYQLRELHGGAYAEEDRATDHTLIVTNWDLNRLTVESATVKAIRRLLAPLYTHEQTIRACFGQGYRDLLEPATDLSSEYTDIILNGLADMIVDFASSDGKRHWRFCCILVPNDSTLPLQHRGLVVRAQSAEAPHKIGSTLTLPNLPPLSLSLRAFLSGQIVYRPEIYEEDITIALSELEHPASAIAVPVEGKDDTPSAILYIVANDPRAFNSDDQRLLRLIGRMVQEAFSTYRTRQQAVTRLADIIAHPDAIDSFFKLKGLLSENDFIQDLEDLLKQIQAKTPEKEASNSDQAELKPANELSFISIEIDQQTSLASRYGDQFIQNLNKAVCFYLQTQLRRIFTDLVTFKLYYIYTGRFYLLLDNFSLEEARTQAERIRRRLKSSQEVSVLRPTSEDLATTSLESMQIVNISAHIGVSSYTYRKISGLLERYSSSTAAGNVRALISRDIDNALIQGRREGGDVVIAWDATPERRGYIRWPPQSY